jgi:hypothetical protein
MEITETETKSKVLKLIEKENENAHKMKVKKIKYLSDEAYDDKIPEPLPKSHGLVLLVGKPASGKSSLALSFISQRGFMKKKYNKLFIFSESLLSGNLDPEHPIFDLPEEQLHNCLNAENLQNAIDSVYGKPYKCIWFFDDCQSDMTGETLRIVQKLVQNRRHYTTKGSVIFITSQVFNQLNSKVRKNCSDLVFFRSSNRKERETIRAEMCDYLSVEEFDELLDYCFDEPHSFIWIKQNLPPKDMFWHNFNKLSFG